jgi:hypothetical protein
MIKKLLLSLTILASGCAAAHAQVPIINSYNQTTALPPLPLPSQGAYTGWSHNGLGEADFFNHQGTGTGGFCWFNGTAASPTQLACLSSSGVLTVSSVVGNASTATALASTPASCSAGLFVTGITANGTPGCSGALTGSLVGNASTASAFNHTPSTCTGGQFAFGIAADGTPGCSGALTGSLNGNASTATALATAPGTCPFYQWAFGIGVTGTPGCATPVYGRATSVNATGSGANSTATTTVPLFQSGGSITMPDANYAATCSIVSPSGFPYIMGTSKTTTSITVTISNGTASAAVISGGAGIDCTVSGS